MTGEFFVHPAAIVEDDAVLDTGCKVWHFSHVFAGSRIGENCIFVQNVMVGPDVIVGTGCKVHNNVSLNKGATLEDDVFFAAHPVYSPMS